MDQRYRGFYARFEAPSKKIGAILTGADSLVGDRFEVLFKVEDGVTVAWLKNRFGAEVGFLNAEDSRKLQLASARDWTICALLSYVAYSDSPDPGIYWGEAAFICFDPKYDEECQTFVEKVGAKLADGVRPQIDLGSQGIDKIMEAKGNWLPSKNLPRPKTKTGTAILKSRRTTSEKMIEQGRAGNKGCYFVSYAFIVIVVVLVAYFVLKMVGVI